MKTKASIRLLRHATVIVEMNDQKILVDPMLSPKHALDPVQNCGNENRFPMVDLPITESELADLLGEIDAVIITHLHRDHWDTKAQQLIDKNITIFCQPIDEEKIKEQQFKNVHAIQTEILWEGISIHRTKGRHGTGEIGRKMGEVSGFVLSVDDESIYIAGDTIWCKEVEDVISTYYPTITILNAGGAKFLTGDPITMTPTEVITISEKFPEIKIIAVHMDTVNHCFEKRSDLQKAIAHKKITSILIPSDGEVLIV